MPKAEKILVIRLSALGDLVLCMQAFADIRGKHPEAEITLLTQPAFYDFARKMPWFDKIILDPRPKWKDVPLWKKLIKEVKELAPTHVYDLQGKLRQTLLFYVLGGPFNKELFWSGAALGCSHPRVWPPKPNMHFTDFLRAQLDTADVPSSDAADLSWLDGKLLEAALPEKFVLFIPGSAPQHEHKRWPSLHYGSLAKRLAIEGLTVLLLGTEKERETIAAIHAIAPDTINFCGRTSLGQLAALARRAQFVVGNDTGPTHLAAAAGAPTLALLSEKVKPVWSAPKGKKATFVQSTLMDSPAPLDALGVDDVWEKLKEIYPDL